MDATRFTAWTRRRASLLVLGLTASLGESAMPELAAKRKKKKKCRKPPRPGVCAGQNQCAQVASTSCEASGSDACQCWLRQDDATSFCGQFAGPAGNCAACAAGQTCVVLGGVCVGGFGCVVPCPDPR
jgi:hypothetical protein